MVEIRQSTEADLPDLLHIQNQAFGPEEGPVVADLVNKLLCDPSAIPYLSLLATDGHKAIGHALFTKAGITGYEDSISATILAPLAVIPESQRQGVGGKLMRAALQKLSASGVDLVFLAGYPDYYSRHGFHPASPIGFVPPYPMPPEHADAWMVQAMRPEILETVSGPVVCADTLNHPDYWRE